MRTRLVSLSAALVAFVAFNGPVAALDSTVEATSPSLSPCACVAQTVVALTDSVSSQLSAELERLEDEARLQRILARRGKPLQPGWSGRSSSAPAFASSSSAPVSYSKVTDQVNPLIVDTICDFNSQMSEEQATNLAGLIEVTADRYGVDPLLVTALVSQESAFYQSATSPVGATGLGQLMPETAAELGVNPRNPRENLDGSVRYLADLQYQWSGSADPTALALASYNAGAGNVELYNGIPPFEETQNYVAVILDRYATLSAGYAIGG